MKSYMELSSAKRTARAAITQLESVFTSLHVAGSARREKFQVSDIELVGIPTSINEFITRTHNMVQDGYAIKHDYSPSRPEKSYRWGDKYRGFDFMGMLIEVFTATPTNFGYIFWLRTGPGDANMACMTWLARNKSPIRCKDGAVWHVAYNETDPKEYTKLNELNVPDEATLFKLLGLEYIEPDIRCEEFYNWHMNNSEWQSPDVEFIKSLYIESNQPVQTSMF